MNLKEIHVFLMVSTTRSLTQAARRLEMTPMAVSRRLAALEETLGVRLLHRTTRAISLTPEGEAFLPYAHTLAEAEQGALGLFSPQQQGASGLLRITAPSGFGRRTIMPLLPALLTANPALRIDLQLSDEITDIVGLGYDVAIRIAPLRDSNLIARKIADNPRILCAAPSYLERHNAPRVLQDLAHHACLRLTNVLQWSFLDGEQPTSISVEGRFSSSNVEGVRALCTAGMGLAQLTAWDVRDELHRGELVAITLEDVSPQKLAIWALFPSHRYLPTRVTLFLDALQRSMGETV